MKYLILQAVFLLGPFLASSQKLSHTNTWSVSLNSEMLLQSPINGPVETIDLRRKTLSHNDTLIVAGYLSGHSAENRESVLVIKYDGKEIQRFSNINNGVSFLNQVPLHKIINTLNANKERLYKLFIFIPGTDGGKGDEFFVARLKVRSN